MKIICRYFPSLILVCTATMSHAQIQTDQYIINEIWGEIRIKRDTLPVLKTDHIFHLEDSLIFDSPDDLILLAKKDDDGKCYVVYPLEQLNNYIGPERCPARMGTRPGKILTHPHFEAFLANRRFLILGGRTALEVGRYNFPMDSTHFFFLRFDWAVEDKPINKKLPFVEDRIILDRDSIYLVDGQPVPQEEVSNFRLYYYNEATKDTLKINEIDLIFPHEPSLKKALHRFVQKSGLRGKELFREIDRYINIAYGEPEVEDLKRWLDEELGLTFEP